MEKVRRIALLSHGPSAELYDRADKNIFDIVIGVNTTVTRWKCDWWCFGDWGTFAQLAGHAPDRGTVIGRPSIFIPQVLETQLKAYAPDAVSQLDGSDRFYHRSVHFPALPQNCRPWDSWSGTSALGLAWFLGATDIDAFGVDMGGNRDHRGGQNITRTEQRWQDERMVWSAMVALLAMHKVRVRRAGHNHG